MGRRLVRASRSSWEGGTTKEASAAPKPKGRPLAAPLGVGLAFRPMADEIENLTREFVARIRDAAKREAAASVAMQMEAAMAELRKAGAIFAQMGAPSKKSVAKAVVHPPKGTPSVRYRRSPEELEVQSKLLLAAIKKTPGSRIDKLASATKMTVATMQTPIALLLKNKSIKKKGLKRTTSYWPT